MLKMSQYLNVLFMTLFKLKTRQLCATLNSKNLNLEIEIANNGWIILQIYIENGKLRVEGPHFHYYYPYHPMWYRTQGRMLVTIDSPKRIITKFYHLNATLPYTPITGVHVSKFGA